VEVAPGPLAERLDLAKNQEGVFDLLIAADEVTVPEQRQLLAQRRLRVPHAVAPPRLNLADVRKINEGVADALERVLELALLGLAVVEEPFDGGVEALLHRVVDLRAGGPEAGAAEQVAGGATVPGAVLFGEEGGEVNRGHDQGNSGEERQRLNNDTILLRCG